MAFPTTGILDDFDRADEGPPPSASWTGPWLQADELKVVGNQCTSNGAGDAYWNPETFGPDTEAFDTLRSAATTDLGIRLTTPGAGTTDGYMVRHLSSSLRAFRVDDAILTQLGASLTDSSSGIGDKFGAEMIDSDLVLLVTIAGVWTPMLTRSDATYATDGYIGIHHTGSTGLVDDFGGGTVVPPQEEEPVGLWDKDLNAKAWF